MRSITFTLLLSLGLSTAMAVSGQSLYSGSQLQQYYQNQDFEGAVQYLKQFSNDSLSWQYHLDYGYSLYMNNQVTEALSVFKIAWQKQPENLQANIYLALIYNMLRRKENALLHHKLLTMLAPLNGKFWQQCGDAFSRLKIDDSAKLCYTKAYQLKPFDDGIVVDYSDALDKAKQKDSAMLIVDMFLQNDTTSTAMLSQKVKLSFKKEDYKSAIVWGEKLMNCNALGFQTYNYLAYSYLNEKQFDSCIKVYALAELENMGNESLTYCAALAYTGKKNYAKSNELLDDCLKLNLMPTAITYFRGKADNYESTKEFKKAIAQYDSAYYIFHKPLDLYYKGRVYDIFLNNKPQASLFYKKYIAEQKKPETPVEAKLFNYIKEYIVKE